MFKNRFIYPLENRKTHNIFKENLRAIACRSCGTPIKIKENDFYIEYYNQGKKLREHIGSSKVLAETVYKKRRVQIAEGKFLDIQKDQKIKFEDFADEYYDLHCKVNNKKSFETADKHNIKCLKSFFSGLYLHEITAHKVQTFKSERSKTVRVLESGKTKAITAGGSRPVLRCRYG